MRRVALIYSTYSAFSTISREEKKNNSRKFSKVGTVFEEFDEATIERKYLVGWMEDARRICDTRMRRKPTQYDVASLFHKRKLFRARDFRKDFVA